MVLMGQKGGPEKEEKNMCKVIACVNEKGGVAKTTTVKNLSAGLRLMGYRVLAIDLDPSANLSTSLGILPSEDEEVDSGILKVFKAGINGKDEFPEGIVTELGDEGFDLVASSMDLHSIEHRIVESPMGEWILHNYVNTMRESYDFVLIDCPAGLGKLVTNGMIAADHILIPSAANYLDLEALQNVFGLLSPIRSLMRTTTGHAPEICGIVFTSVRAGTNNNRENMRKFREMYEGRLYIFKTFIPMAAKIPESDAQKMSIFRYDKNCIAAINYYALVEELLGVINGERGE